MFNHVFNQHGDEPDAANFAQSFGISAISGYVVDGFEFAVRLDDLELDVASGAAAVQRESMTTASPNIDPPQTRNHPGHPVQFAGKTAISLFDNTVNHVWLTVNTGSSNSPIIEVNTSGEEPTHASLKLGEVDTNKTTSEDAISDHWNYVAEDGTLTYPSYDAAEWVADDLSNGAVLYDRGGDTVLYVFDGNVVPFLVGSGADGMSFGDASEIRIDFDDTVNGFVIFDETVDPPERIAIFGETVSFQRPVESFQLEGLAEDPNLESGLIWHREDEELVKMSPDGDSEVAVGWTV